MSDLTKEICGGNRGDVAQPLRADVLASELEIRQYQETQFIGSDIEVYIYSDHIPELFAVDEMQLFTQRVKLFFAIPENYYCYDREHYKDWDLDINYIKYMFTA